MKSGREIVRKISVVSVLFLVFLSSPALAEKWGFAAIGDNRAEFLSYRRVLQEIRDQKASAPRDTAPTDFVLAVGDIDPVAKNYEIYKDVFKQKTPIFFPVRGNHEEAADVSFILRNILPSHGSMTTIRNNNGVNYYADWKSVRIIALDQYCGFGKRFDNKSTLRWIEKAIVSARRGKHVFISFHEPYLPEEPGNGPFWAMLLKHKDTVRAVFCGHYHIYDRKRFPDEQGGIEYINVGNAGQASHSDRRQTIVRVMIDGRKVSYRIIQAPDGTSDFQLKHQWEAGEKTIE